MLTFALSVGQRSLHARSLLRGAGRPACAIWGESIGAGHVLAIASVAMSSDGTSSPGRAHHAILRLPPLVYGIIQRPVVVRLSRSDTNDVLRAECSYRISSGIVTGVIPFFVLGPLDVSAEKRLSMLVFGKHAIRRNLLRTATRLRLKMPAT